MPKNFPGNEFTIKYLIAFDHKNNSDINSSRHRNSWTTKAKLVLLLKKPNVNFKKSSLSILRTVWSYRKKYIVIALNVQYLFLINLIVSYCICRSQIAQNILLYIKLIMLNTPNKQKTTHIRSDITLKSNIIYKVLIIFVWILRKNLVRINQPAF